MRDDDAITRTMLLIHEVPAARELEPAQRTGEVCLWCSTPAAGREMVDLGCVGDGYTPHACASCRRARIRSLRTYFTWANHWELCADCPSGQLCSDGDRLRLAHLDARQMAGKTPPVCAGCKQIISWARRSAPVVFEGMSGVYLTYRHVTDCQRSARRAP
ncbi:hypothetical protein ACFOOM_07495 [Streptomyces echinoruber]|uniref:Uncharacterized protein n=1 Tax=Streptomyces echinoruber TaxID=68898 RepID=A0A918VA52_9ACTN|nr:hypothetical protein [Streptomyces echinoruber]GGZ80179.1 hypothetical protein GCM10010389_17370 [Streptomyces echinoruber]